jgi:hypothetical protein
VLVPSDERRRSGSNYTPRKLTEPIVRKTLEPILARLAEEKVAGPFSPGEKVPATFSGATSPGPTPQQLLDLKICDPAMGSGAFLVEACRQLADHLVVAWQRHGGMPPVPPDEDELLLAKRLVAQKCLYGVDKNPMAADLAKLSLWLATLAKDHPFTFLDHSLRSGDSLVGLGRKQIASLHWEEKAQRTTVTKSLEDAIRRAAASRRDILEGGDFLSPELKAQKLALADDALSKPRLIGDCVIAAFFAASKPKERQATLDRLTEPVEDFLSRKSDYVAARAKIADLASWLHGKPRDPAVAASADALTPADPISHPLAPFHWELEFPEVFQRDNPGFDAIVGNPPFMGGRNVTESMGDDYSHWLSITAPGSSTAADLCCRFFRIAYALSRPHSSLGLVATNTIAQGDTRAAGLRFIRQHGGLIYDATRRLKWPGDAAVTVSVVHILRRSLAVPCSLDGRRVPQITAFLFPNGGDEDPCRLRANEAKSFQGSNVLGLGFTIADTANADDTSPGTPVPPSTANRLIALRPANANRVFPYLGGDEVNSNPTHAPDRRIINFGEMDDDEARMGWPDLWHLLEAKVKPERITKDAKKYPRMVNEWWKFWNSRPELYAAARETADVLAISCGATKHIAFASLPSSYVFSHKLVVIPTSSRAFFAVLQARIHEYFAVFFSATLEDRFTYNPTDCFETFPFPENFETDARLEAAGKEYYDFRAALMVKNDEGLTKTYNRFHDPGEASAEIARLRELHAAMDRAVLDAYGWQDVQPACGFALDWLDLDDDELADTLASAPDDIRERIESADYFFPDAASACRFQSHIKKDGKGKLPWRYRWPDDTRDDILARLLALNAARAELERLTGLPGGSSGRSVSASPDAPDYDPGVPSPPKAKRAKKGPKRASKKSASHPMFKDDTDE